jgi:hypothetical protein
VGTPGALTNSGLSSGWQVGAPHPHSFRPFTRVQVWGGATPSPQRNVSASSAPATTDPLSSQGEVPFRSNMTEGWRSNSGTWVDSDAGEFALVSLLKRRPEIACLMSTFELMLTSIRAGQDRSASRKVSPSLPVL